MKHLKPIVPFALLLALMGLAAIERTLGFPWLFWLGTFAYLQTLRPGHWFQWAVLLLLGLWLAAIFALPLWVGLALLVGSWWVVTVGMKRFPHPTSWTITFGALANVLILVLTRPQPQPLLLIATVVQVALILFITKVLHVGN